MSSAPVRSVTPREIVRILSTYRDRWIVPTIVCAALSVAYALVMTRYWEASQSLVLRQEARSTSSNQPGKFADLYEMRTLQETILELIKSRQVVVATLKGASEDSSGAAREPSDQEIEKFRKRLQMLPPNGAEFGKTEVFYLRVKDPSRAHAIRLVTELCDQLDRRLSQLREERAQSLIAELEKQVELAAALHDQETHRLHAFEGQLGADLGELRMLHSAFSGQSDLRQQLVQLEGESRQTMARVREAEQLLTLLQAAENNPEQIVAMPNSLLVSQPALSRLKNGLVDAQLRTARLGGTRSSAHPRVQAAFASEEKIRHDLHGELQTSVEGAQVDLQLLQERSQTVTGQLQGIQQRLGRLAEQRTEYSNRVAALASSRTMLDRSRQKLNEVQATQAAAHSASLVSRIDQPETGPYPMGPGRAMVVMTGTMGGLIFGLGFLFLTVEPTLAGPQSSRASGQSDEIAAKSETPQAQPEPEYQTEWWESDSTAPQVERTPVEIVHEVETEPVQIASTEAAIPPLDTTPDLASSLYAGMSLHDALEHLAAEHEATA